METKVQNIEIEDLEPQIDTTIQKDMQETG